MSVTVVYSDRIVNTRNDIPVGKADTRLFAVCDDAAMTNRPHATAPKPRRKRGPKNPIYVAIGRNVAKLRHSLGMTQDTLADAIGWSRSTIAGVEAGTQPAGREQIVAMAGFFNVPVDQLMPPSKIGSNLLDSADEMAWLNLWRQLGADDKAVVIKLLSALALGAVSK